jgi:uncharacterized membrane protein YraQ (UPF0718 family)
VNGEARARRPFFKDPGMIVLLLLVAASAGACWAIEGLDGFIAALASDGALILEIAPRLAAALLISGLLQVLVPKETVARWLGGESGWKGLAIATVAGALTPGGPIVSFPLVVALGAAGADIGCLVAYLTAWSTLSINRVVVWEIPLIGTEFVALRMLGSFYLPFLAGWLARLLPCGAEA